MTVQDNNQWTQEPHYIRQTEKNTHTRQVGNNTGGAPPKKPIGVPDSTPEQLDEHSLCVRGGQQGNIDEQSEVKLSGKAS